jgi:hypothetical protein
VLVPRWSAKKFEISTNELMKATIVLHDEGLGEATVRRASNREWAAIAPKNANSDERTDENGDCAAR